MQKCCLTVVIGELVFSFLATDVISKYFSRWIALQVPQKIWSFVASTVVRAVTMYR